MPDYTIRDPRSGRTLKVRGDSPPTEAELEQLFASAPDAPAQVPQAGGGLLSTLGDVAIGAAKGLGNSVVGAGQLIHQIPGVTRAVDALYGQPGISQAGFADANQRLEATNTAQSVGKFGEQVAETLIPSRAIARAATALAGRVAPVVGRAANVGSRAAVEGVASGGIAAVQQGDAGSAALVGAAVPASVVAARKGVQALVPKVQLTPVEAAAVQFGQAQGIPLDAGTATGSSVVRTVQKRVSDSLGGANVAEAAKAAQQDALERTGGRLASASNQGGAAVDAVGAGERVRASLTQVRARLSSEADTAYDALRQIEASAPSQARSVKPGAPFQSMRMAVDVRPAKQAMQTTYQQLLREKELVPLMGDKGRALVALDALMQGPDFAPLSVADGALSELKDFVRIGPGKMVSQGQRALIGPVRSLDAQVRAAAAKEGPAAVTALDNGRAAIIAKYQVNNVIEMLSAEPKAIFDQLTRRKDAAVELVRGVQKYAPQELPNVGRAWLEEAMHKATAEGRFSHADALWGDWQKLGSETKQALFPHVAADLDRFFLLAKKMAENPNPSGTAKVASIFNVLSSVGAYPVAKLMYSPQGVRLLTRTMSAGSGNVGELTAALGRITATQGTKD